jgi:MFS family permease
MVGVSESYLGAFAVELGHRNTALAVLVTVPLLAGALVQALAGPISALLGGRKRMVVVCVLLQALSQVAFSAIATTQDHRLLPLLAAKMLFWVSGMAATPAWSDWMAALTAGVQRERYFAFRSTVAHLALLISLIGGGFYLHRGETAGSTLGAFALLQGIAFAARTLSGVSVIFQVDLWEVRRRLTLSDTFGRIGEAFRVGHWRIAVYLALVTFAVHLSGPFFTPYMLRVLKLDYVPFTWLAAVSILAKVMTFPLFRRLTDRIGMTAGLFLSGMGVVLIPLLWARYTAFPFLVGIQVLNGIVWAGFEFASFQLLLRGAPDSCRMEFLALFNCLNGLLAIGGSLIGSALLETGSLEYTGVFILSGIGRTLPLLLLVGLVSRWVLEGPWPKLFIRVVSVRPVDGVLRRPILLDVEDEEVKKGSDP